jgi:hypothetical protein
MRNLLGRLRRSSSRSLVEQLATLTSVGDGSTLSLDFTTGVLDSRITFTRASGSGISGTGPSYIGSNGYVQYAGTNVPRFDYDPTTLQPRGLLIEGSATNYSLNSSTFSGYVLTNMNTPTAGSDANPEGTANSALQLYATATTNYHGIQQNVVAGTNTTLTISFWAKARNYVYAYLSDLNSGRAAVRFNLQTGATDNSAGTGYVSAKATPYLNGWYRCEMTTTVTASATHSWAIAGVPTTGATLNSFGAQYTGTNAAADGIYVYGIQTEAGNGASSLIPTGASTAMRAADRLSMTSGVSAWAGANAANRSYAVDFTIQNFQLGSSDFPDIVNLTDGTNTDRHYFYNSSGNVRTYITGDYAGTSDDWQTNIGAASSVPLRRKFGLAIQPGVVLRAVDGTGEASITGSPSTFAPNALYLGPMSQNTADPGRRGSIVVRSFKYWPYTLTQTDLNARTTL